MGKLDTVEVNGPEGEVLDWDAVDWRHVEDDVRRLRQRIFTATQAGGPETGPQPPEAYAPFPRERSAERATEVKSTRTASAACQTALPVRSTLQPRLTPSGLA